MPTAGRTLHSGEIRFSPLSHGADTRPIGETQQALLDLLVDAGYNPSGENSALLAVVADPHIFLGTEFPQYRTEEYDGDMIAEINSLSSLVTELVLAGDLISYHSMTPGLPPYARHRVWAEEEYVLAKSEMARFNYRTWMVPGNHDTNAYESNAELFRENMQVPSYQSTVFAGVPVFLLNTGNGGMLDPAQEAWFRSEASLVAKDQEVLVVAHIPPFFRLWYQAGVKRILTDVFKNHGATVWVISGHNHAFAEQRFEDRGVTYIQTQVTTASSLAQLFGDNRNPGYGLLALQDGRVISRIFKSMQESTFEARPAISVLTPSPVLFALDDVVFPMCRYEEGFYDHTERVMSFDGVDCGSYINYCKRITFRIDPSAYLGEVDRFFLSGVIASSQLPVCSLSTSNDDDDSWTEVAFPEAKGGGLYEVVIPQSFRSGSTFYLKLDNGSTLSVAGFSVSGWALSADPALLTGYERWISNHYRTLERDGNTHPQTKTPGTDYPNIVNFGFNLMPQASGEISGRPNLELITSTDPADEGVRFTFVRMLASTNPGISYDIQSSQDLKVWNSMPPAEFEETILRADGDWEEVEVKFRAADTSQQFYRVRLTYPQTWPEA